ncbi:beta-ketoacyl [acyl carrier protein] synthase domain-containing protein, partial [Frankia sp. CiP1_Cm_nod1]|uniref:beta-ketoacyl [acyl carrier protein] synthase domain-containing protein n=1 Tax=Frankia sp. CiP1_Cm_nod1 TaxID=2897160 RepID=UPI0020259DF9
MSHAETPSDIAVVGLAARLPKAAGPGEFWQLLENARSAVTDVPAGRWEGIPDDIRPLRGGFLDGVADFDPEFFGISPREAEAMDPQQRLVLELGWEALEDARVVPAALADTRTGVFVGAIASDYAGLVHRHGLSAVTRHTLTGLARGVIANRLSYLLGLRGPSLTVDTAQSSSLVAVHLACESLRSGESELALAAGVHLNLTAETAVSAQRFGGLSPDGRCFTFDARANGFVHGEGGAVVVLKPLAAALADGNRIHAVIRGSAVNSGGATAGLTVPSARAQRDVVRAAAGRAGVDPRDVRYVELHGTGTALGDPIEASALGAAYGAGRPAGDPLLVGSVKTNIGHLEGAGGIVGLVKTVLAITHRVLPPSLNFATPNPRIPFEELRLRVVTALRPWPHDDRPLLAGVSSWGVGGTNCHVVVGEAPTTRPTAAAAGGAAAGGVAAVGGP